MMRHSTALTLVAWLALACTSGTARAADEAPAVNKDLDGYAYYGLGARNYTAEQRRGRDTWIFWTAGNQKFFRLGTKLGGSVGASVEYFRLLDSRDRDSRFQRLGLINEPNCAPANEPDENGLWLDTWKGDKYGVNQNGEEQALLYPDVAVYGAPTGVVGLRKYKNPKFDPAAWKKNGGADGYYKAPDRVEPPYHVGMTCGFCHMGFHPQRPPNDPSNPKWENLAANLGNQYLHEGRIFFGSGKVVYGDQNGGRGLGADDFLHHLGETQQRGTSETSRLSYDFINNPNAINSVFFLHNRPSFPETLNPVVKDQLRTILKPGDAFPPVHHVLKDGSDSQSIPMASIRVYVNIGMFGDYWITRLWNPLRPEKPQRPFSIDHARAHSDDWNQTFARMPALEAYLATYAPMRLEKVQEAVDKGFVVPDGFKDATDADQKKKWARVARGQTVFAEQCARCHSSKQPDDATKKDPEKVKDYFRKAVAEDGFLDNNALTDDVRYPVSELKTNAARALATNATDGHIWNEFSSPEYKSLPAAGMLALYDPVDPKNPRNWQPPDGGRGYYRTSSLINIWATAPFLHNNSVGTFPGDLGLTAEQWPTVEGRLKAFDDAIGKLLNPKRRAGLATVKRVLGDDTYVQLRLKGVTIRTLLEQFPEVREIEGFQERVNNDIEAAEKGVDQVFKKIDFLHLRDAIREVPVPETPDPSDKEVTVKLLVPAGTPINLLANVHVDNALKATVWFLKYKAAKQAGLPLLQRKALDALLKLSEYPDLVEDHGHEYGAELSDADKAALIEYLKKL